MTDFGSDMPAGASPPAEGGWVSGDEDEDTVDLEGDAEWDRADEWWDEHGKDSR